MNNSIATKNNITLIDKTINRYLSKDERLCGIGIGGSESLTIFISTKRKEKIVRKIISECLITPSWKRDGIDVMLAPCLKAERQVKYLQNLPSDVKKFFPQILSVTKTDKYKTDNWEYMYDMTYVEGLEVSQFIREHTPPPKVVAILYAVLFKFLSDKIHCNRRRRLNNETLEQSYFNKIEQRLELSRKTAPTLFGDRLVKTDYLLINGVRFRNIDTILSTLRSSKEFRTILEPRYHTLVMGDTNTENIKIDNIAPLLKDLSNVLFTKIPFDYKDLKFGLIDPRAIGFHEGGIDTGVDDPMYDNKPWHNSIGNYDNIHGEFFDLHYETKDEMPHILIAFHQDSPYASSYKNIEDYFKEAMTYAWDLNNPESRIIKDDPYWLIRFVFMMGTHFMAMPPFHFSKDESGKIRDDAIHQKRPLALYAEGIKWLNIALDMLEGTCVEFLGFTVPAVVLPNADVNNSEKYVYTKFGYHIKTTNNFPL